MKSHGYLFERVIDSENLRRMYRRGRGENSRTKM